MRSALLLGVVLSAGCVNMSGMDGGSRYACAAPEGVACDSVSGTYANALHRNLPSQRAARTSGPSEQTAHDGNTDAHVRPEPAAHAPKQPQLQDAEQHITALRSAARVLRLWVKPWEDADGDLWDQGHVYVQVDNGHWQLDHVQQRIRDRQAALQPPAGAQNAASVERMQAADQVPSTANGPANRTASPSLSPFGAFPSLPASSASPATSGARQP